MLCRYLASGVADERNGIEARDWLESAAEQGVGEAESDLAELAANGYSLVKGDRQPFTTPASLKRPKLQ
jgi:TPR repeat protein